VCGGPISSRRGEHLASTIVPTCVHRSSLSRHPTTCTSCLWTPAIHNRSIARFFPAMCFVQLSVKQTDIKLRLGFCCPFFCKFIWSDLRYLTLRVAVARAISATRSLWWGRNFTAENGRRFVKSLHWVEWV
jgi:hypothetical protein